jgi:NAD(P)-dependent dehydrogenase (short-subunit alcohol dehydrogenase family)
MSKEPITVITGAAGALGSGIARHLLQNGHKVALLDRPEAKAQLAELAASAPQRALGLGCDVRSASAWAEALREVRTRLGPPTGAALIAGGWSGGKNFHESSEQVWSQMVERNLDTTRESLRASVAELVGLGRGSVVVVGARPAVRPWEGRQMAEYTATKAAVLALAQAVATEVLEHGVRVNVVLPSTLDTAANRASMPNADFTRWVAIPSLAKVVAFLLSDDAHDVSGAALPVYGRA